MPSPPPLDLGVALPRVVRLAEEAGRVILATPRRPGDEAIKGDGSPVTQADRAAHAVIDAGLRAFAPAVPILSEEGRHAPFDTRAGWVTFWLVDPLDGTKEYLKALPDYTVNIALVHDGVPVLGVVHAPARGVTYAAAEGLGSWRTADGESTRLVARPPAPGRPVRIAESRSHPSPETEAFLAPYRAIERVATGSSLKFCLVADGTADAYVRLGPTMEWDVAAGDAVVRWASEGAPTPSSLVYNTPSLRNRPFVIGYLPPPPAVVVLRGGNRGQAEAVADALRARVAWFGALAASLHLTPAAPGGPAAAASQAAGHEASGATVIVTAPDAVGLPALRAACRLVVDVVVGPGAGAEGTPDICLDAGADAEAAAARIVEWLTSPERLERTSANP
ncbi:MAG: 3'(2'),5'-bisphosphate nucleotidase CysQ [Vicinamibacterales bacterium]